MQKPLYIVITRTQPFHVGHMELIDNALCEARKGNGAVLVLVGSSNKSREFKNPLTYKERKEILSIHYNEADNLYVAPLKDFDYDDTAFENNLHLVIQEAACQIFKGEYYTPYFVSSVKGGDDLARASWARNAEVIALEPTEILGVPVSASGMRESLSEYAPELFPQFLPEATIDFLSNHQEILDYIKASHKAVEDYKSSWGATPFPVQFHATDAVIRDIEGNFLMIRRGGDFGEGKVALAGGFLEQDLTHEQNMYKEVLEETNLDLESVDHKIVTSWLCDAPERANRGRMTTMVFLVQVNVPFAELTIRAGDDASSVLVLDSQGLEDFDLFNDHAGLIRKVLHLEEIGVPYVPSS